MGSQVSSFAFGFLLFCAVASAQASISGRVVDETGAGIASARVELRAGQRDLRGILVRSRPATSRSRCRRPANIPFAPSARASTSTRDGPSASSRESSDLAITLNHLQEFSDRIDVTYSPPAIDPQQPAERKELDNTEIQAVPYPAPQDYRNALPLMDGVVQDNAGRAHFNGGDTSQTNYTLDGFNISDPVTGRLETRVNIDTIQSMDLETSRFSAENGRGSAGVLDLKTKMGDDRWRFGGTNFIPGVSTEGGWHINKWTPRLEFSGPLAKGRAWFHNGFDAFYSDDIVHGLPRGQNRTSGLTGSDLTPLPGEPDARPTF